MKPTSNSFALDAVIRRMWQLRDRMKGGEDTPELWQQWAFVRRVIAHSVNRKPAPPPK